MTLDKIQIISACVGIFCSVFVIAAFAFTDEVSVNLFVANLFFLAISLFCLKDGIDYQQNKVK